MFNRDLDGFVHTELEAISSRLQAELHFAPAVPDQLYHLTDAAGIGAVLRDRALRAPHSRLAWGDAVVRYGIELVKSFLAERLHCAEDPLAEEFCRQTLANFNPRGSHFDCFIARLFQDNGSNAWMGSSFPGYALGLRTADMPIRSAAREPGATILLQKAIYSREQQLGIVRTLYEAYEAYYASALRRFGEKHRQSLQTPCWDMFRRDLGEFLVRFRSPLLSHEEEWLAIALVRGDEEKDEEDDGVTFDITANRLAPGVVLDITKPCAHGARKLPLESIVIAASLPFETTKESLQAFLRRNRAPFVTIRQANIAVIRHGCRHD